MYATSTKREKDTRCIPIYILYIYTDCDLCTNLQVMQLAGDNNIVEIEKNMFKGKIKAKTAYYGNLINKHLRKEFLEKKTKTTKK